VVPVLALDGGVMIRAAGTEAAVDLVRLAELRAAAGLCELVSLENPGGLATGSEAVEFARNHDLELVTVSEVVRYRLSVEPSVIRMANIALPTSSGDFRAVGYKGVHDFWEHIALTMGDVDGGTALPAYLHRECIAGDVLGSQACGCAASLATAIELIRSNCCGIIVYSRSVASARACGILARGRTDDTALAGAGAVLRDLGVRSAYCVAGDPHEQRIYLEQAGVRVVATRASLVAAS
jgi:3,4-dihydroxy 2-butanone 4-phosphate synthase/GTP cyclohydrolase II